MLCAVLARPGTAGAVWNHTREILHGTANTLEQGELIVGIITPLGYGITDELTLMSHPVLVALLTPNAGLRYRLVEHEIVTMSAMVDGAYTPTADDRRPNDDRPMGHVYGGLGVTFQAGPGVLASVSIGYQYELEQRVDGAVSDDHAVVLGFGIDWLAAANHLFVLTVGTQYSTLVSGFEATSGSFLYAYAFDNGTRLGVGLAFGRFPVAIDAETAEVLPVWPVLDWWARF